MQFRSFYILILTFGLFASIEAQTINNQFVYHRDPTINKVLSKYIDAVGGKALQDIRTVTKRGTLIRGNSGKVPFEMISKTEGKWYYKQIFAYGDVVCYGSDGKNYWVQDTREVGQMTDEERNDLQLFLDIQSPLKLINIYPEIEQGEISNMVQKNNITLKATTSKGRTVNLVFDKETGLLMSAGDISFDDYRQVENVKIPYKIYIGDYSRGEIFRLRIVIDDIVLNSEVSDVVFNQPGCVLQLQKSQLYTLRKQVIISEQAMDACIGIYRNNVDTTAEYYVSRQQNHLMISGTRFPKTEIKPMSELDFFVRFWNLEFHFQKDQTGKVFQLEFGQDRKVKARKIS